jgi:hypothetical protein
MTEPPSPDLARAYERIRKLESEGFTWIRRWELERADVARLVTERDALRAQLAAVTRERDEARDNLRDEMIAAYVQGATDVHLAYGGRDLDFTESASDYADNRAAASARAALDEVAQMDHEENRFPCKITGSSKQTYCEVNRLPCRCAPVDGPVPTVGESR